jgi:hypothetical protein
MNTAGFTERLRDWRQKITTYQEMLRKQARRLRWRHYLIGLLATLLSLAVGYDVLLTLRSRPDASIQITMAAASFISAVLTGIITFYSHAGRSERSRLVSARLDDIRNEIDALLELPPQTGEFMRQALWQLNDKLTDASKGAPAVPFQVREAFMCYDDSPTEFVEAPAAESK